jgi:hypothetical protein
MFSVSMMAWTAIALADITHLNKLVKNKMRPSCRHTMLKEHRIDGESTSKPKFNVDLCTLGYNSIPLKFGTLYKKIWENIDYNSVDHRSPI